LIRREAYPFLDAKLPAGADTVSGEKFDLHPPVMVMKDDGPFVISTNSQREVVANLHLKSLLYIWGGPVAALWGLWEILNRLGQR